MKTLKKQVWLLAIFLLCGCNAAVPTDIQVEDHVLKDSPQGDSFRFTPEQGTQEQVLAVHQNQRNRAPKGPTAFYDGSNMGYTAQRNGQKMTAVLYQTPSTTQGTSYDGYVEVAQTGQVLHTIPIGKITPAGSLLGLWAYNNHWAVEVIHADQAGLWGEIIVDGVSLNQQEKYKETFGFQLIEGKPFYFYQQNETVGISYDGKSLPVSYKQVPHHGCCSAGGSNPTQADNMVSFFASHDGAWHYVEVGVFRP